MSPEQQDAYWTAAFCGRERPRLAPPHPQQQQQQQQPQQPQQQEQEQQQEQQQQPPPPQQQQQQQQQHEGQQQQQAHAPVAPTAPLPPQTAASTVMHAGSGHVPTEIPSASRRRVALLPAVSNGAKRALAASAAASRNQRCRRVGGPGLGYEPAAPPDDQPSQSAAHASELADEDLVAMRRSSRIATRRQSQEPPLGLGQQQEPDGVQPQVSCDPLLDSDVSIGAARLRQFLQGQGVEVCQVVAAFCDSDVPPALILDGGAPKQYAREWNQQLAGGPAHALRTWLADADSLARTVSSTCVTDLLQHPAFRALVVYAVARFWRELFVAASGVLPGDALGSEHDNLLKAAAKAAVQLAAQPAFCVGHAATAAAAPATPCIRAYTATTTRAPTRTAAGPAAAAAAAAPA